MGEIIELSGELQNGYKTIAIFVNQNYYTKADKTKFEISDEQWNNLYVPINIQNRQEYNEWKNKVKDNNSKLYKYRLYLKVVKDIFDINHNENILTFILFNPSTANQFDLDPTIKNCLKLAQDKTMNKIKEYNGIEILNLYNIRNPKIDNLELCSDVCNKDLYSKIQKYIIGKNVVLAWGCKNICSKAIQKMNENKDILFKLFKDKNTTFYTLDSQITRHPNSQAWSRIGTLNNMGFDKNAKLFELKNINNVTIKKKGILKF